MDRLQDRYLDNRKPSPYGPYDEAYIRDKFPNLNSDVQKRLAVMITKRRMLLQYRREHSERLMAKRPDPQQETEALEPALLEPINEEPPVGARSEKAVSQSPSHPMTELTKATTLQLGHGALAPILEVQDGIPQIHPVRLTIEDDDRTSVAASTFTSEIRLEVPPRPKEPDGQPKTSFNCSYCCIPIHIISARQWR